MIKQEIYQTSLDQSTVMVTILYIAYCVLVLFSIHILKNKMGSLFVEAEILRTGNE